MVDWAWEEGLKWAEGNFWGLGLCSLSRLGVGHWEGQEAQNAGAGAEAGLTLQHCNRWLASAPTLRPPLPPRLPRVLGRRRSEVGGGGGPAPRFGGCDSAPQPRPGRGHTPRPAFWLKTPWGSAAAHLRAGSRRQVSEVLPLCARWSAGREGGKLRVPSGMIYPRFFCSLRTESPSPLGSGTTTQETLLASSRGLQGAMLQNRCCTWVVCFFLGGESSRFKYSSSFPSVWKITY